MKARHLALVSFLERKETKNIETRGAAGALAAKYTAPGRKNPPLSVTHIEADERGGPTKLTGLKGAYTRPRGGTENPRDYGAYVLFHNLLDFGDDDDSYTRQAAARGERLARVFTDAVVGALGFPRLGKVCMIVCFAGPRKGAADVQMGDHFTAGLVVACADHKIDPPLVAGWDDFVTVAFPGNPSLQGRSVNTPANAGRKVSVKHSRKVLASKAGERKWVWVYEHGGYVRKPAGAAGWSDHTTALPAGPLTAVITDGFTSTPSSSRPD